MENTLEMNIPAHDVMVPFQLDRSLLRGRFVRLNDVLDQILRQHAYPLPVAKLLAEVTVMAAVLASTLKYEGVFTLQTKSDGPVRFLVADVTSEGGVRAYAQFDPERLTGEGLNGNLLGEGYLAFTADLSTTEDRYQGVVDLGDDGIMAAVQRYFKQSEQLQTGIVSFVRENEAKRWEGGCLMLQRLPREGGVEDEKIIDDTAVEDDWFRAMSLLQTCTEAEATSPALAPETLLYRLFHEDDVRVYEAKELRHACRCSQERVEGMLRSMAPEEVKAMTVDGKITVTCAFCSKTYAYTGEEALALAAKSDA